MQKATEQTSRCTRLQEQELRTVLALQEHLVATALDLDTGPRDLPILRNLALAIEGGDTTLVDEEPYIEFLGNRLYFDDLFSFYVVYKEIFLYEDYYVDFGVETPTIIDCGAHIGMATLFFKRHYPQAKVICFEPDPRNFELLSKNTRHLADGIERHELGITADGLSYPLMRRQGQSMASSIYARSAKMNNEDKVEIKTSKLSRFLDKRVDFLKLDIEGAEDSVLEEAKNLLANVHYIFIEFHTGNDLPLSRLTLILGILDDSGFTYQVERAREYQTRMMHRPFTHLDQLCTHVIHAKNTNW